MQRPKIPLRSRLLAFLSGALLAAAVAATAALAVNSVNPTIGSVWTYLGPTFGADWVLPIQGEAPCPNFLSFGAVGDNATDNLTAWNSAKASTTCLEIPAGTFLFSTGISYTFSGNNKGFTLRGAGQDVTILHFPTCGGTCLNITKNTLNQSVHVLHLTFTTGTRNTDTGIRVHQVTIPSSGGSISSGYAANNITSVTMRSDEGYPEQNGPILTHGWAKAVWLTNESNYDFYDLLVWGPPVASFSWPVLGGGNGIGVQIDGDNDKLIPNVFNFVGGNFNYLEKGIVYGARIQGVNVGGSNFTGCYAGIFVLDGIPPGPPAGIAELIVTGSQFNNRVNVYVGSILPQVILTGNHFYMPQVANSIGIDLHAPNYQTLISDNVFSNLEFPVASNIAIKVEPTSTDFIGAKISGNSFLSNFVAIELDANAGFTYIGSGNQFISNTTNVVSHSPHTTNVIANTQDIGQAFVYATVSGLADNGAGLARLTVDSTTRFVNGQAVLVKLADGSTVVTTIIVIDATHMDLLSVAFAAGSAVGHVSSVTP